jgi:hypothetical protein
MKPRLVIIKKEDRSAEGYCSECKKFFHFDDDPRAVDYLYGAFRKHLAEQHSSQIAS